MLFSLWNHSWVIRYVPFCCNESCGMEEWSFLNESRFVLVFCEFYLFLSLFPSYSRSQKMYKLTYRYAARINSVHCIDWQPTRMVILGHLRMRNFWIRSLTDTRSCSACSWSSWWLLYWFRSWNFHHFSCTRQNLFSCLFSWFSSLFDASTSITLLSTVYAPLLSYC